ncbi:matrix metalloproteinase-16-like [Pollicipes pollicipes]|uniref:matrix metalloproteinase-16-like n=1 Tax=Pollicipes pollicipes TaxID=41117 RepID=UPI00188499FE|nr:matrix metalloproteinase-16-like [Pollicipes pollicipes]XP_037089292.1 matrix metalloproteinase-16-like [Pollicipes pollicipes]
MAALALLVIGAVVGVQVGGASPLVGASSASIAEAATYLARYGYSSSSPSEDRSGALVTLASNIAEFQQFAGLEVTGELNDVTLAKMRQPRCGVKDKLGPSYRARRRKRYALQGSRWRVKNLSYKITSWPSKLQDEDGVRKAIRDSFQAWEDVSALKFKEVAATEKANIEIRFAAADHSDGDPFDGPGGTLAHAFFPIYGGDAHFDDDEQWTINPRSRRGIDLFMTAAHEFGHSLGLSHSSDNQALMAPFYKPPSLSRDVIKEDDILAIQELYGKPASIKPKVPATTGGGGTSRDEDSMTKTEDDSILCTDSSVDAIFTVPSNNRTYVFKGENYWRLTDKGVEKDYPRKIAEAWDGAPNNVDAVLTLSGTARIYFFKGSEYWRMTGFKMDAGYPKKISAGFRGIEDNVAAVFQWIPNGKVYFFKGNRYWRYDPKSEPEVASDYPRPINTWDGIPNNIDSVMTYKNKRTYFFKGNEYYRFDDIDFMVDDSSIPYPRSVAAYWFGCSNQPSNLVTPSSVRGDMASGEADGDAGKEA